MCAAPSRQAILLMLEMPQATPPQAGRARSVSAGGQEALSRAGTGVSWQTQRPADSPDWSPSQLLNFREAFCPSLIVRPGEIFINSPDMTFEGTTDGSTDYGTFTWHTDHVRSLSNKRG